MRSRLALVLLACSFAASVPGVSTAQPSPVTPYRTGDRSLTALNILPPGQGRHPTGPEFAEDQENGNIPHNTDQRGPYDALIQGAPSLTAANLTNYFKDASFGIPEGQIERQYSPPGRSGVVIARDKQAGVPHIYGTTREDTMFGAGYASAEDRLFMMDVLRHVGRGRSSELLGPSQANIDMDCAQWKVADYSEAELQAMLDTPPAGVDLALFEQARVDVVAYVAGINARIDQVLANPTLLPAEYPALQIVPEEWKATDTVAVASLIGGNLGVGGGGEMGNALFLNALEAAGKTPAEARAIFNDFRFIDDPEAVSSTDDPFPWNTDLGPIDPDSSARPDEAPENEDAATPDSCATASPLPFPLELDGPFGDIPLFRRGGASNALLVGSSLSANGIPMAVFGPQVGYWSPEILMELDIHGPGLHARGVGFPGISLYVLLGRGDGYGYSATSASGDQVDTRAVPLCNTSGTGTPTLTSDGYLHHDGTCHPLAPLARTDTWSSIPNANSCPPGAIPPPTRGCVPEEIEMTTQRVELPAIPGSTGMRGGKFGIVQSRGMVDGDPVLFARQRVSYGGEVDSAMTYVEMMDPSRINSAADFQRAFARFNFTFNWFYVDGKDIAFQLGGAHPLRAQGSDMDLPMWNDSEWAWQRLQTFAETPKDRSPKKGYITSWNNKQAPGFRAADDTWGFAPVDRVQPLDDRIQQAAASGGKVTLVELVKAMADAATVDLRGDKVLPLLLQAIGDPGNPQLQEAVDLLEAWHAAGSHRRDLDDDGTYEHEAAIALMDAWWTRALEAIFEPTLGDAYDDVPYTRDDAANSSDHNGSSFNDGWYGHVHKDLRSVLGLPVEAPFSREYCGQGNPAACRTALIASLEEAVLVLQDEHTNDPATWEAPKADDEIRFTRVGLEPVAPIDWQNRPTFQQVLQFAGASSRCGGRRGVGLNQILGTVGRDVLRGTPAPDVICGRGGKDKLVGLGGRDVVIGGGGKDRIRGHGGKDFLSGGGRNDRIGGGGGRDRMRGGPGDDRCGGGPGKDQARGCERGRP